jgi:hypothetical protein
LAATACWISGSSYCFYSAQFFFLPFGLSLSKLGCAGLKGVPELRAETGVCARRRSGFLLLRQKKVTKEKATLLSATPSLRYGATWGARSRGAPQNSLRAFGAPLEQLR